MTDSPRATAPSSRAAVTPSADRGHLLTEQRLDAALAMDQLEVPDLLGLINKQDRDVPEVVGRAIPAITPLVEAAVRGASAGGRLVYLGAGTSGRLGVLDASECPPTFHTDPGEVVGIIAGGDSALRKSSEGMEDDPEGAAEAFSALRINGNDTVIGIAAGGTTPYVLGGLAIARRGGATTGLICCVNLDDLPDTAVLEPIQHRVELLVGPEVVTGSTRMKAGTATKLALNMISTAVMVRRGKVWGNLMVDVRPTNAKLHDRAVRILRSQIDLSPAEAADLLNRAGGRVKVALISGRLGLSIEEAEQKLRESHGRLGPILGPPR